MYQNKINEIEIGSVVIENWLSKVIAEIDVDTTILILYY